MSEFEDYISYIEKFHKDAAEVTISKCKDYAGTDNPMRNFMDSANIAGVSVEQGILVRMSDKISRARSLTEKGSLSGNVGEKLEDTLKDLSNYAAILSYWAQENYNSYEVAQLKLPFEDKAEQKVELETDPAFLGQYNFTTNSYNAPNIQTQDKPEPTWYDKFLGR